MKKSAFISSLLLLICSLIAGMIIFEISLRLLKISHPYFDRADFHIGYSLRPGAAGWWTSEGKAYFKINSAGIHDDEHSTVKPPNTFRIVALGDSMTEGRQVKIEETFSSVIERVLKKCPALEGKDIETINFGVAGYGTAQQLLTLRHRAWEYEPNVVLLTYFANDLTDNSPTLRHSKQRPYFSFSGTTLILDNSFRNSAWFRTQTSPLGKTLHALINRSVLLQVLNKARLRLNLFAKEDNNAKKETDLSPEARKLLDPGLDAAASYHYPEDVLHQEAWLLTEELMRIVARETSEHGALFLLAMMPSGTEINPDPDVQKAIMEEFGVKDLKYTERRLGALSKASGFSFLPLTAPMIEFTRKNNIYLHGFENNTIGAGHLNIEGHKVVGELISEKICNDLL